MSYVMKAGNYNIFTINASLSSIRFAVYSMDESNTKYSYPENKEALAASCCIGMFVKLETFYDSSDNN